MTVQTKATLKGYFNIGDYPSEANFADLIDSFFAVGGDAGGADRILGNTDNYDLSFFTNNLNRLHIQNNGNVGIGITVPTAKLCVVGNADTEQLIIRAHSTQTDNLMELQKSDASPLFQVDGTGKVDVRNGSIGLVLGADLNANTRTNATNKYGVLAIPHYINTEEPFVALFAEGLSTSNTIYIGGGKLSTNAAATIKFFTANNTTTLKGTERMVINYLGKVGIGNVDPIGRLHVGQESITGGFPVLVLSQADVDEDFIKFIGTSDTSVDRALVDAANFSTPGNIAGWLKINVQDDQATNPIVDGDYYIPFYTAPTA